MAKPTKITYSQLFSFGDYQNETIGTEIELEPGDDPAEQAALAAAWVVGQHNALQKARGRREQLVDVEERMHDLERVRNTIKAEADRMRHKVIQAIAFLLHVGLHPVKAPTWIADSEIREELQKIVEQRGYYRDALDGKGQTIEELAREEADERKQPF